MRKLNLIGQKFGLLTVVSQAPSSGRYVNWVCLCECGNKTIAQTNNLRSGHTKSCGCLRREGKYARIHGMSHTRIHDIWLHMISRCENSNSQGFDNYGGRGIKVCSEWRHDFKSFYYWAISNGYKDNLSIDRIDVNSDYCPRNCRWANRETQNRNRRNTIFFKGKHLVDWCTETGIKPQTARARIRNGWTIEKALTTPVK